MFKDKRESIKKVLEMGIGCYEDMKFLDTVFDPGLNRHYHRGASLYMWRDFFPNATIYGADYKPETLFEDERIKTFLCDERKKEEIETLVEYTGLDIDIFIDDGSHAWWNQAFLAKTILPLLQKDVIYIIEDVEFPDKITKYLEEYECSIPRLPYTLYKVGRYKNKIPKDRLMVVKNK